MSVEDYDIKMACLKELRGQKHDCPHPDNFFMQIHPEVCTLPCIKVGCRYLRAWVGVQE